MILSWKEFRVDLGYFKKWLDENVPKSDGIVAAEEDITIVETEEFSSEDISLVNNYWDNITEQGELDKFNRPNILSEAIISTKEGMVSKTWVQFTSTERKIALGLSLTTIEEDALIG